MRYEFDREAFRRLREARQHENRWADWTQTAIAAHLGVQPGAASRWDTPKRGRAPRPGALVRLAALLDVEPSELIKPEHRGELRHLRYALGLEQGELAEQIGMHQSGLVSVELGRRPTLAAEHVPKLADALGVDTDHILAELDRLNIRIGRDRKRDRSIDSV